jgi:hypothetical protein
MASIAFPAWCLGHDPSAQILCVSYAQDLADKLAREHVRRVDPSRLFAGEPTRVSGGREIASIVAKSMVGRGGRAKGSFGGYALNTPLR